jgi:hypothetical protein
MAWYAARHSLAGFANTKQKNACNARFIEIGDETFIITTRRIRQGGEVFVYYPLP